MERWTIDPVAGTTTRTVIHDHNQEFPRYDERRTTRPYRYIYSVALPDGAGELAIADTRLFRHDLENGNTGTRDFGRGRHPGELVFSPRSTEAAADDGWQVRLVVTLTAGKHRNQVERGKGGAISSMVGDTT